MGVISMKLVGDETFAKREDLQVAVRFAFQNAGVDCIIVGFKIHRKSTKQSIVSVSRLPDSPWLLAQPRDPK